MQTMVDTTITLISPSSRYQDEKGVWRTRRAVNREIFARMQSVSRSEFFSGGQSGFRPEMQFTVFHAEYQGEAEMIWNGARYAVYRTYQVPGSDDLELYVQREIGVHGVPTAGEGAQNGA